MYLEPMIASQGKEFDAKWKDREALCQSAKFRAIVYQDIIKVAKFHKLNSLEIPKHMKLTMRPFTIEEDQLTPTQKLKRNVCFKMFSGEIERMYKEGA